MISERVLVFREEGWWLASCCDRNVVATAESYEKLPHEMGRMLAAYHQLASNPDKPLASDQRDDAELAEYNAMWQAAVPLVPWDECRHGWTGIDMIPRMIDSTDKLQCELLGEVAEMPSVGDYAGEMLAVLLMAGVCFVSTYNDVTKTYDGGTHVVVLCSDIFGSGSDGEHVRFEDIMDVYRAHQQPYGLMRWVAIRRQRRPTPRVERRMRERGAWDEAMDALPPRS